MSYQNLELSPNVPIVVEHFVRQHLDMQFADVHCMLRLPIHELDLHPGCNFAAANSLLALVSGLSALLTENLSTEGQSKIKFTEVMKLYYPWDLQPPKISDVDRTIDHLYKYFRNPLAHSLGLKPIGNFMVVVQKNPLSEVEIETLENSDTPLDSSVFYAPTNLNGEDIEVITLNIENFYWGVREILKRLTADASQMLKTETSLKLGGIR